MSEIDIHKSAAEWKRLFRKASGGITKELVAELYSSLSRVRESGSTELNAARRFELQELARTMADGIFELTKEYPNAIIAPPQELVQPTAPEPKIAPSRLFRGRTQTTNVLVGREQEWINLDDAWNGPSRKNVVTIVGWGGLGKTTLVVHWAAAKLAEENYGGIERYFDWSFYSQGTRAEGKGSGPLKFATADLFMKQALEFFGDPEAAASAPWEKGERLAHLISPYRTLLILDGVDSLQDAKTGELRDESLRALLRGLAANNNGLCVVTTRQRLCDLGAWHHTTAPEWRLARLSKEAGGELLRRTGVIGTQAERERLAEDVRGHSLTLTLLGKYLTAAHEGDIRKRDLVSLSEADDEETSGDAFRVMEAYEQWLENDSRMAELAILRLLGLFDGPATPDCIEALRQPPAIRGVTSEIINLTDAQWNVAVKRLVQLGLVEEQPWEQQQTLGYTEEDATNTWNTKERSLGFQLGEPKPVQNQSLAIVGRQSLDAHPLIREFFARKLQQVSAKGWAAAHSRLFEYLCSSVPYWPEGRDGLRPLYQAVAHGCQAGLYRESLTKVYWNRILRGTTGPFAFYSVNRLGALGADLAALGCFFTVPWKQPARGLSNEEKAWLLNNAAHRLRALGRLSEAREPVSESLKIVMEQQNWDSAAVAAANLSELDLTLGDVTSAELEARKSREFADKSDKLVERTLSRIRLAVVLQQSGKGADARASLAEAESLLADPVEGDVWLYSDYGYRVADLMMSEAERAAWLAFLETDGLPEFFGNKTAPDAKDAASTLPAITKSPYAGTLKKVKKRSEQSLKWATQQGLLLYIGLNSLSLARADLYRGILERSDIRPVADVLDQAINTIRMAGSIDHLPPNLLTRSFVRILLGDSAAAQADLNEAWQIADRGPMRLFLADVYLHRARLFFRTVPYPWQIDVTGALGGPKTDLATARRLVEACGYGRRISELEDAERIISIAIEPMDETSRSLSQTP